MSTGRPQHDGRACDYVASSATTYNQIKVLDQQRTTIEPDLLESLHDLFVKHKSHEYFGISLLHRHHDMLQGHAMVQSQVGQGVVACRMQIAKSLILYPCAFYVTNENKFVAYEYTEEPTPVPATTFLSDLSSFLVSNDLRDRLALSSIQPKVQPVEERLLAQGLGTISTPLNGELDLSDIQGTITEWSFLPHPNGRRGIRAIKKCVESQAGGHKVEDIEQIPRGQSSP